MSRKNTPPPPVDNDLVAIDIDTRAGFNAVNPRSGTDMVVTSLRNKIKLPLGKSNGIVRMTAAHGTDQVKFLIKRITGKTGRPDVRIMCIVIAKEIEL